MFGICNLAVIPLRLEPSDRSEIVSQILFGEHFEVLEKRKQWRKVKMQFDQYEGWIDEKQFQSLTQDEY
nr:SH3 domain-containing protein [Flavobacterium sp.]